MKTIDPSKTIHSLVKADETLIPVLIKCGFDKIASPGMIESVGRFMTLDAGIRLRKIDRNFVKETFNNYGYIWEDHNE